MSLQPGPSHGGRAHTCAAAIQHEPYPRQRYQAGDATAPGSARARVQISSSSPGSARATGSGVSWPAWGHLCTWLLLARTLLPDVPDPGHATGILGSKDHRQPEQGRSCRKQALADGMASPGGLGVCLARPRKTAGRRGDQLLRKVPPIRPRSERAARRQMAGAYRSDLTANSVPYRA